MSLLDHLRVDIADDNSPAKFSNAQLILFLEKATRIVSSDLCLSGTNQVTVDSSGCVTTPATDPQQIEALILLQAECLIGQRNFNSDIATGTAGVLIEDGEQKVDTRNKVGAHEALLNSPHGPCAQYEKRLTLAKLCRLDALGGKLVW